MNRKVRTLLGGMSAASLIVAGTLPALAKTFPPPICATMAKTKVESSKDKAKDKAAAKDKADKAASGKAAKTKAKSSK